jgi:hypothetical protein
MANKNEPLTNSETRINFTLNVSANDLDPEDKNFKVKAVLDFVPAFSNGSNSGLSTFNANKVHRLLTFISERVIKKVIEQVYYDRENEKYVPETELPANFKKAKGIYDKRREEKEKNMKKSNDDYSYLDLYERKPDNGDTNCIECIVNEFFDNPKRPVWDEETNVTRIIFEQQSPPTLTVESRTIVNGDKRPK